MNEKILNNRRKGMLALLVTSLLYLVGLAALIYGIILFEGGNTLGLALLIPGAIWNCIGWPC